MGTIGSLDNRLVELAGSGHRSSFSGLRHVRDDTRCRLNHTSEIRPSELPGLPAHDPDNAHPRYH